MKANPIIHITTCSPVQVDETGLQNNGVEKGRFHRRFSPSREKLLVFLSHE
jgi:hypothetical protein